MLLIIIVISCDCRADIIVRYMMNKFLKHYLSINKTLSSALSAVYFSIYKSNIEMFKLTVYEDVIISIEETIILSINNEVRFNLNFVIRFSVSNSTISFKNNVILKNKALIDGLVFMIIVLDLLFLVTFFDLRFSCRLRYITLLLN